MLSLRILFVFSICLAASVFAQNSNINAKWVWYVNPSHNIVNRVGSDIWVEYIYGRDVNTYELVEIEKDGDVVLVNSNPFVYYKYIRLSDLFITYGTSLYNLRHNRFTISYLGSWVVEPSQNPPPKTTTKKPKTTTKKPKTTTKKPRTTTKKPKTTTKKAKILIDDEDEE